MKFLSVTIPIKALYKVCMVVLSTESVDEILKCDHSNQSSVQGVHGGSIY